MGLIDLVFRNLITIFGVFFVLVAIYGAGVQLSPNSRESDFPTAVILGFTVVGLMLIFLVQPNFSY